MGADRLVSRPPASLLHHGAFTWRAPAASELAVRNPQPSTTRLFFRHRLKTLPVLVVTQPGTFAPAASVVVLDDIDKDSRIVLHDPTSASRSAKGWAFGDITGAAALAFTVHEA